MQRRFDKRNELPLRSELMVNRLLPAHGQLGLAIILIAEGLLFFGNDFVGHWFTPIVWTGYILLVDAIVFKLNGTSLLVTERAELLVVVFASVGSWWLFEFYNAPRFWNSDLELWWHYHNLAPNVSLRRVGFDWAFATIFPAMFLTAQLLKTTVFKGSTNLAPLRLSRTTLFIVLFCGAVAAVTPLVFVSEWLVPLVWLSLILLLDPINYLRGWPSITGALAQGDFRRLLSLLVAGLLCGFLWEFWNYWAITKWTYTVPYLGNIKIFEMPVLGYLGFPPFAVECWVMYIFFRSLLSQSPKQANHIWVESGEVC